MRSIILSLAFATALLLGTNAAGQPSPAPSAGKTFTSTFVALQDGHILRVKSSGAKTDTVLKVEDGNALKILRNAAVGDQLELIVDDIDAPKAVSGLVSIRTNRDTVSVLLYMVAAAAILLAFGLLATGMRPLALVVGADNRYSASKLQMAAWFFVLFTVYLASILMLLTGGWLDYLGKISIPENLVILSGLSALTFGAAKAITVSKVEDAKASSPAYLAQAGATLPAEGPTPAEQIAANKVVRLKVDGAHRPRFRDLVTDDEGYTDLGNCQALFISLLAVSLYLVSGYAFLSQFSILPQIKLPDVDTTLLALFGLGQGAYLAKKAAAPAGKA